jgi:hypothetical protein
MVIALIAGMATAAQAAPTAPNPAGPGKSVAAAWIGSCPAGDVCAYTGANGGGSRCNWSGNDSDWTSGGTVCSWAADTPVKSIWNNGVPDALEAVNLYRGANSGSYYSCLDRTFAFYDLGSGVKLRSHKWVAASACNG